MRRRRAGLITLLPSPASTDAERLIYLCVIPPKCTGNARSPRSQSAGQVLSRPGRRRPRRSSRCASIDSTGTIADRFAGRPVVATWQMGTAFAVDSSPPGVVPTISGCRMGPTSSPAGCGAGAAMANGRSRASSAGEMGEAPGRYAQDIAAELKRKAPPDLRRVEYDQACTHQPTSCFDFQWGGVSFSTPGPGGSSWMVYETASERSHLQRSASADAPG